MHKRAGYYLAGTSASAPPSRPGVFRFGNGVTQAAGTLPAILVLSAFDLPGRPGFRPSGTGRELRGRRVHLEELSGDTEN